MIKSTKRLSRLGKYMSLLLRHDPSVKNLDMSKEGFVSVDQLCKALEITKEELNHIVKSNNKKRFSYNNDESLIRANQGHSLDIKLGLRKTTPPNILYHGTTSEYLNLIYTLGLKKMSRHHVHLSEDIETAKSVGMRRAKNEENLWIIGIDTKKMIEDGYTFFISNNGVYLVDHVPSKYFITDKVHL